MMHFWVCWSGNDFTSKGMHVLELVGRETMDLLAIERLSNMGVRNSSMKKQILTDAFGFMEVLSNLR